MEFKIHTAGAFPVAELTDQHIVLSDVSDFLDLMGNAGYQGVERILIHKTNLEPAFFDLKTGIAGEILQKFSTYNHKLAILGDFTNVESKSLRDFIRESNRTGRILFVDNREEALNRFGK